MNTHFPGPCPVRRPLYCDDCGQEKMAEVRNGKLVISDRRHGQRHVAVLNLAELTWMLADGQPAPRGRTAQTQDSPAERNTKCRTSSRD